MWANPFPFPCLNLLDFFRPEDFEVDDKNLKERKKVHLKKNVIPTINTISAGETTLVDLPALLQVKIFYFTKYQLILPMADHF